MEGAAGGTRGVGGDSGRVTLLRRLDHVAVVVRDTESALAFYSGKLGLSVASSEEVASPHVKLTYLDAGNAYLQLVEPLDDQSPLARWLDEHGEGLHHICFGVDDVEEAVASLSDPGTEVVLGSGRGRASAFVTSDAANGVVVELTGFDAETDVDAAPGYLGTR
ncbi:MAG: VOC family protein [Actinobacteria bacterium]|nr:MAG: VOC family protein [Actinomycetota bacterium]